jgi:hypothetical protein
MKVDTTASERHTLLKGENKMGQPRLRRTKQDASFTENSVTLYCSTSYCLQTLKNKKAGVFSSVDFFLQFRDYV